MKNKKIMSSIEVGEICSQIKNSKNEDFIKQCFRTLLSQVPINFHDVTATQLWRARKTNINNPNGFSNITDIIYPPKQHVKKGRLNKEKMPVLYASVSNHGCLAEIGAEPGDRVHVSAFTLNPGQKLHCGLIGEIVKAHKWDNEKFYCVQDLLKPYLEEQRTALFIIDSFLAEILSDNEAKQNGYMHTTILADVIREGKRKLDAIVYPGVESFGAKNYAIDSDAMLKFNIPDMYLIEIIRKHPYGFYEWRTLRKRESYSSGIIKWKDL